MCSSNRGHGALQSFLDFHTDRGRRQKKRIRRDAEHHSEFLRLSLADGSLAAHDLGRQAAKAVVWSGAIHRVARALEDLAQDR